MEKANETTIFFHVLRNTYKEKYHKNSALRNPSYKTAYFKVPVLRRLW